MAKHFLNDRDRALVQETITRVGAGRGNNRPIARRRRGLVSDAAGGSVVQFALLTTSLDRGSINPAEKTVTLGSAPSNLAATLLDLTVSDTDAIQLTPRQQNDPNAPDPPPGGTVPQVEVTMACVNATSAALYATAGTPKLVYGYVSNVEIGGQEAPYFVVTGFVHSSAFHASASSNIASTQASTSVSVGSIQHGESPFLTQGGNVTCLNPFGFAIDNGGLFRAEQTATGDWVIVQAECPA